MQGSTYNKSVAAKVISKFIAEKKYHVIGNVPEYDRLRASLSCGLKKWWSVGLTANQREHFELIYKRLEWLNKQLFEIKANHEKWREVLYDYYDNPENPDIVKLRA